MPTGEKHWAWTGDNPTYGAIHQWVRYHKKMPSACEHCGTTERDLQWANRSREYRRDLDDWMALCPPCHGQYDKKPTCKRGHPNVPENRTTNKNGGCRVCLNVAKRAYEERRRRAAGNRTARVKRRSYPQT